MNWLLNAPHVSREAEWLSAAIIMAFALALLRPGATFSRPGFVNLAAVARRAPGAWRSSASPRSA